MGPLDAIKTCLAKSFQFKDRASRSEFWWFAPIGLIPPILVANEIAWDKFEFFGIWRVCLLILVALPLLSAGSRRLQDTGEEGHQIIYPFMPPILLWVAYQALFWFSLGTIIFGVGVVVGILALLLLLPGYIFALFVSFMLLGPTIGMLLVSSEPKTNQYDPNPNEVPQ